MSYDEDEGVARACALEQFRWFTGGWKVMAELPGPAAFDAASASVTEDEIAEQIPCGPDVTKHVGAVKGFLEAGFTDVCLVQTGGGKQDAFLDWSEHELLPALRKLG